MKSLARAAIFRLIAPLEPGGDTLALGFMAEDTAEQQSLFHRQSAVDLDRGHSRREKHSSGMSDAVFDVQSLSVFYGNSQALEDVTLQIFKNQITAIIGPSGCGKSTFIRCLNRMNDLIPSARVEGKILFEGEDIYAPDVDLIQLRRVVGMVFQKPNPFPKSIYDNVAFGLRINGLAARDEMDDRVRAALEKAALWESVSKKLKDNALSLSGGEQQRLCIARAIAVEPEVVLMDEPCSALDPIATARIEELMHDLKKEYTIVIVTHNMQQAARVSDRTAFFLTQTDSSGQRYGKLIEVDDTERIFTNPKDPRTNDYITGRFG